MNVRQSYNYGTEAPVLMPEKIRRSKEEYMRNAVERVNRRAEEKFRATRSFSFLQVFTIVACISVMISVSSFYMISLARSNELKNEINALRTEYRTLCKENALLLQRIEESRDYGEIMRIATEELGMQIPEKQQVISYTHYEAEYVVKGAEIPHE